MDIVTERSKMLEDYIKNNPTQIVPELKAPVLIGGQNQYLPVYRIPLTLLIYNIRNGRFSAELLKKESDLKRKLDPTNKQDAKILQEILLQQKAEETENLMNDLKTHGQLDPGLVTFDGAVINANRRMAILSKLHVETGDDRYGFLKVGVLPKTVNEKELWRIEAGLQFAKDFRLEYGPVNELLKLREGVKSGLTFTEISQSLGGRFTEKELQGRLKVLALIDSYLESTNQRGQYIKFQGQRTVELFNSLNDNVVEPLSKKYSKKAAAEVIPIAFRLIESGNVTYLDLRKLRSVMLDKSAHDILVKNFEPENRKSLALNDLVDRFQIAKEIVDAKDEQTKPKQLVEKAIALIGAIDPRNPVLRDKEMIKLLEDLQSTLGVLLALAKR
ncbi:MAG: hypothetical protein UW92_C0001G0008 [Candidatus Jorgensenbacteria bacterium GW2011_GWA2_45_13]|uniref:ParB/Sulfiredoxin domain-containing protein n=1 Tax=Candidatus Jorgensenbacteria bacterium GW2011_GWA2_45_13 TaxID=1618662 RepID=A0A0G1NH51_9BACT|nr:MAG: hypothetical protein UW92_C0001G0008 [Candidatus Jorgensenbacteria bacterium GW2011_GWA2_45_13]